MESTSERQEIGKRVSELMFMLDLNQTGFAEKVGTTQTTVRNISKGLTKPRYELLESICNAFPGLSKDWLMQGIGEAFPEGGPKAPSPMGKPKADDYLMEKLNALERSWKADIEVKNEIIKDLQYIVDNLKDQLNMALGKLDLSEEMPPVSVGRILDFKPLRMNQKETSLTASLTVGNSASLVG